MQLRRSAPAPSETDAAIFLLERAARFLFLPRSLAWTEFNALHAFAHADGHYHLMGCMLSAASCNKWWMDEIIGTKDYAAGADSRLRKLGENHVYFLPYLMGERSPHNDPNAQSDLYRYDDGYDKSGYDAGCA